MSTQEKQLKLSDFTEQQLEDMLASKKNEKESKRNAYKGLVTETIPPVIRKLLAVSELLALAKTETFDYFKDLMALKAEVYGIKKIDQQSHTFSDDKSSVTIGYRVNEGWDDTVGVGVKKVTTFLHSLAKDPNSAALVDTVFNLLKQDRAGNLRASRVIELQKLTSKFNDAEFTDGVLIISEAYRPVKSVWFIEATTTDGLGEKHSIPLSMSGVDFPPDFDFDFLTTDKV